MDSSMWMLAAWWCVVIARGVAENAGCDVTIGDDTFREDILVDGVDYLLGLAIDYSTHTLYFSYKNGSWYPAKLDLRSRKLTDITDLRGRCTFSVDQVRRKVHAGCERAGGGGGLYTWDSNPEQFVLAGEAGENVQFVYYNNNTVYYSVYPQSTLRLFREGRSIDVPSLPLEVRGLVFDANDDWILHNDHGVYRWRPNDIWGSRYRGGSSVWALAVDSRGSAYTCDDNSPRGIWQLHDPSPDAILLLDVKCSGLTFEDDDTMIYVDASRHSIIRLVKC